MSIAVALISESGDHYTFSYDTGTTIEEIIDELSQSLDSELKHISSVDVGTSSSDPLEYKDVEDAICQKIESLF